MLTLRCTAKTLKRFGLAPLEDPPVSSGCLGDWYANLLNAGRKRWVLCVSEVTRLPVILPARNEEFPHRFSDHLRAMLCELGIPPGSVDEEVAEARDPAFGQTASRSVLGVMNSMTDIVRHVHERGELEDDPLEVSLWLGSMLHGRIDMGAPAAATRQLFGLEPRGPVGSDWLRPGDAAIDAKLALSRRSLVEAGSRRPPPAARLTLDLEDVDPPIRRELWVDERTTLSDLHLIFQVVMGWQDRHLYRFEAIGLDFVDPVPEAVGADARTFRLENLQLRPGDEFVYAYDFGDDWRCRVRVEERNDYRSIIQPLPHVVAGVRAGPPEDVGGPGGFAALVGALANPRHPEHEEFRRWAGERYAPERFDVEATNEALTRLVVSGAIDPER